MTPHSVGGSLNELGEARGTVLAVKLDRRGHGIEQLELCLMLVLGKLFLWHAGATNPGWSFQNAETKLNPQTLPHELVAGQDHG